MRVLSISLAALLAIAGADRADAREQGDVEILVMAGAVGRLWLPAEWAAQAEARSAVVVVNDIRAPDARAEPYAARLNASGIAVLELVLADELGPQDPERDEVGHALDAALITLSGDPRFAGGRVGLLAFGSGARAAFAAAWDRKPGAVPFGSIALLYPGCDALSADLHDLSQPDTGRPVPLLLLHGEYDPANAPAACAALAEEVGRHAPVQRIAYCGAGYAWDRPRYGDLGPETLPRPDGAGRVRAEAWPALVDLSSEHVARFFSLNLTASW